MNIDVKDMRPVGANVPSAAAKAEKQAAEPGAPKSGSQVAPVNNASGDSVSLTQSGMLLANVGKEQTKQPEIDAQRVAQIRQKLQSGQYVIDPARVSNKMLGYEFPPKS